MIMRMQMTVINMQSTPDNSNLALTQTKIDFPWISFIYCNVTLGNSNLPLTRSNFGFPSDHFQKTLPSITRKNILKFSQKNLVFLSVQFKYNV